MSRLFGYNMNEKVCPIHGIKINHLKNKRCPKCEAKKLEYKYYYGDEDGIRLGDEDGEDRHC